MKKSDYFKIAFSAIILFFIGLTCKDNIVDNSSSIVFPASKVSYSQQVQPLLNYKCSFSGCHDDNPTNTRLSLTSYFGLTKYPGIVVPGLPDNSILIQRLDGRLVPRMPLFRDTLSQNHYNGLKTWIKEGAQAN